MLVSGLNLKYSRIQMAWLVLWDKAIVKSFPGAGRSARRRAEKYLEGLVGGFR